MTAITKIRAFAPVARLACAAAIAVAASAGGVAAATLVGTFPGSVYTVSDARNEGPLWHVRHA